MGNFKCSFDSLKNDVTVLESAKSQLINLESETTSQLKQHSYETPSQLYDLLTAVEDKKDTVNTIKEITHPCGGHGWEEVVYLDFRDPYTPCPGDTTKTGYPGKTHTCGFTFGDDFICAPAISFPVDREYTSVCGRIKAYESGLQAAFGRSHRGNFNINQAYLSGVSLTHSGDLGNPSGTLATHIWSFTSAPSIYPIPNPRIVPIVRCPCDSGTDAPSFVGEDYFCEIGVTTRPTPQFNPRNSLWDDVGCEDDDECCSRIKSPYFIKHLSDSTTQNIDLRVCNFFSDANTALEIIELYVQYTNTSN